jgi:hypothetical protein
LKNSAPISNQSFWGGATREIDRESDSFGEEGITMTDVVEIAKERHAWLATELAEVSYFLRMADALLKQNLSKSNKALGTEDDKVAVSTGLATAHPCFAAAGGNGAEAEYESLLARELKPEERVFSSRAPTPALEQAMRKKA